MTDHSPDQLDDAPLTTSTYDGSVAKLGDRLLDAHCTSLSRTIVTIDRPSAELFSYRRDFANVPSFMNHVEQIDVIDRVNSHWVVLGPADIMVEWDARITDEREGEYLAWASAEGADVSNSGPVDFRNATGGRNQNEAPKIVQKRGMAKMAEARA